MKPEPTPTPANLKLADEIARVAVAPLEGRELDFHAALEMASVNVAARILPLIDAHTASEVLKSKPAFEALKPEEWVERMKRAEDERDRQRGAAEKYYAEVERLKARVSDLEGEREDWLVEDGKFHAVEEERDRLKAQCADLAEFRTSWQEAAMEAQRKYGDQLEENARLRAQLEEARESCAKLHYEIGNERLQAQAQKLAEARGLLERLCGYPHQPMMLQAVMEVRAFLAESPAAPPRHEDSCASWSLYTGTMKPAPCDCILAAPPPDAGHGPRREPCVCPGCPATVPMCWVTPMCRLCASEDCEHDERISPAAPVEPEPALPPGHEFVPRHSGPASKPADSPRHTVCPRCDEAACMCDWELCKCGEMREKHQTAAAHVAPSDPGKQG